MICFARCNLCLRSVSVEEIKEYASHKSSREWWEWQLSGLCNTCSTPEEVKEDGRRNDGDGSDVE